MNRRLAVSVLGVLVVLSVAGTTPALTLDGDGYAAATELGTTNPLSADTDGDGLVDHQEPAANLSATVGDGDGDCLPDGREYDVGTDPNDPDTDGDGLADGWETRRGLRPLDADTDDDGLPDGAEVNATETLPGADPRSMDVYVEVDWEGDCKPRRAVNETKQAFATAPVRNPDGSRGIDLHVVYSDKLSVAGAAGSNLTGHLYQKGFFDHRGEGYRYAFVSNTEYVLVDGGTSRASGVTLRDDAFIMACGTSTTFMHELGHVLGLSGALAPGIDSFGVSRYEYPSVMNYHVNSFVFSNGTSGPDDFDDWGYLAEHMDPPPSWGLPPYNVSEDDVIEQYQHRLRSPEPTRRPPGARGGPRVWRTGATWALLVGFAVVGWRSRRDESE